MTKLTELEQEMYDAIRSAERYDEHQEAKNAAEVAKRHIKRAMEECKFAGIDSDFINDYINSL